MKLGQVQEFKCNSSIPSYGRGAWQPQGLDSKWDNPETPAQCKQSFWLPCHRASPIQSRIQPISSKAKCNWGTAPGVKPCGSTNTQQQEASRTVPTSSQQDAGPVSKHALNPHLGDRVLLNMCSSLARFVFCKNRIIIESSRCVRAACSSMGLHPGLVKPLD